MLRQPLLNLTLYSGGGDDGGEELEKEKVIHLILLFYSRPKAGKPRGTILSEVLLRQTPLNCEFWWREEEETLEKRHTFLGVV